MGRENRQRRRKPCQVMAEAGAPVGLTPSRLSPKSARNPGIQFWAVSKDKFSTSDLILQNCPRASQCSGKHHFDRLERRRHCWSHHVGGGHRGSFPQLIEEK